VVLFYQEWKNLIGRVAQIKQLMGERHWAVTPRSFAAPPVVAVHIGRHRAPVGDAG